jgi:LysR family glycine cleavage system transcriptional activator
MQALRALESFARHGAVWRAADELYLTRSAVSHQLRLLERDLGFALLQRMGKGVALTPHGRRYANDVRRALAMIDNAGAQHGGEEICGALRVSCTPGLASMWLCTHIATFQNLYPGVFIRILTPRRLDDVSEPDTDLFIAYGDGPWPNKLTEPLAEVEYSPICSPALLNRIGGVSDAQDLFRAPLLHLGDFEDWTRLFAAAQVIMPDPESGMVFSDMNLVLSAAIAGQGIAMGDELTCGTALGTGQLVRPLDLSIKGSKAYHLVMDHQKAESPVVMAFRDWLRVQLRETLENSEPAPNDSRL